MKIGNMLTVMIFEADMVKKYTGLKTFFQLSTCLSQTGAKQGQAHLENSSLSPVTSAFLLKE